MTSNVIDDLIISASWDPDKSHVNFRLSIEVFRQLISALNHTAGRWAVCDNSTPESCSESEQKEAISETSQTASNDEKTTSETVENATKTGRRSNQNITNSDAKRLYSLAKKYPKMNMSELDNLMGFYDGTIRQCPKTFYLDDTYREIRLSQIVRLARVQMDRFSGQTFTGSDVADWGISSEFRKNDD